MEPERDVVEQLSSLLSYWKGHVTLHHVLASELSYSLIFDNIRPDKVKEALATVGLESLPNRFLLIQVDDYYNYSSKMRITQEFFQKTSLIDMIREGMSAMRLTGFTANLIGLDKIICFLCCPELEGPDVNQRLLSIAEAFKQDIRLRSAYTISVCISQRCDRLVQFSKMYPTMDLALSKSYFSGKEFSILLEEVGEDPPEEQEDVDLNQFYPELLASVVRGSREKMEGILQEMIQAMLERRTPPQKLKMELIRLIQRLGDYCAGCGVPESRLRPCCDSAINRILSRSFLSDTRACFRDFYEQAVNALEEYSTDETQSFRAPVEAYIATHYGGDVRLGDLAGMMGFSEGHFARTFRKQFGITFVQYLTDYRIRRSQELLAGTHLPIEQIAYRVGINSYSYFCTCFKRCCGLSPGAFRATRAGETHEPDGLDC